MQVAECLVFATIGPVYTVFRLITAVLSSSRGILRNE